MKKIIIPALALGLVAVLVLGACHDPINTIGVGGGSLYTITVSPEPEHGRLILSSTLEPAGKAIRIYLLPDPGYVYKEGSIGYGNLGNRDPTLGISDTKHWLNSYFFQFNLAAYHTRVTAEFIPNTAENAAFGADPSQNTVSIARDIQNGFIVPDLNMQEPGYPVTLNVFPDVGYIVDTSSFEVYEVDNGQLTLSTITVSSTMPYTIIVPNPGKDILVKAKFVSANFGQLVVNAGEYLQNGNYDTAVSMYAAAYQKRSQASLPADQGALDEVIFYHSIGKLGTILIDTRVRELLGAGMNRLHMGGVPTTIDDWMCDIDSGWPGGTEQLWYKVYKGINYGPGEDDSSNGGRKGYDAGNPPLWYKIENHIENDPMPIPKIQYSGFNRMDSGPVGFPGDFEHSALSYIAEGQFRTWYMYYMLMLCQLRDEGLNVLLQRMEDLLFGAMFEEAATLAATLRPDAKVPLYDNLKNRFRNINLADINLPGDGLERYYGTGQTFVGKAELDYIFGTIRMVKAAVQYMRGYDWLILTQPWLIGDLEPKYGPDQLLDLGFRMYLESDKPIYNDLWSNRRVNILPLRGKYMQIKNAVNITNAKAELKKALDMINSSMDYWHGTGGVTTSSRFSAQGKSDYQWAKDCFAAAKRAMEGGGAGDLQGNFQFLKKLPKPGETWPATMAAADYAINIQKLFTPGVFNIRSLVVTEPDNGMVPAMYKIPWYYDDMDNVSSDFFMLPQNASRVTTVIPDDDGAIVNGRNVPYMLYSFELNMENFRAIFPRGFEQTKYVNQYSTVGNPDYNPSVAGKRAFLYEVFPTVPIWPERPTYLAGPGGDWGNKSAQYLYKMYHDLR